MTNPRAPLLSPETRRALERAFLHFMACIPLVPVVPTFLALDELDKVERAARLTRESVDIKLAKALESLKTASGLIDELELSLRLHTEKLTVLMEEVERYSNLAMVEEDKAKAILTQLDITLHKSQGKERWFSLAINLIAGLIIFFLGIFLGPKLISLW